MQVDSAATAAVVEEPLTLDRLERYRDEPGNQ